MNKKSPLKTVRVFVSSTFRDMHAERDFLNSSVFPELRSRCAKKGLDFVGIDLRWGVTEEESRQRKAIEICLDEIKKCNFFISLLGDRYGWIPPPEEIPQEKFEAARSYKDLRAEDAKLLDEFYQLDETYKVPVYHLRNDIVTETSAQKLVHFWEEAGLEHAGDSITAREIYLAQDKKLDKKTFFYLRKSDVYENPHFPKDMIPIFIDQDSNKLSKLSLLKKHIQNEKNEIYTANYEGLRIDPSYPTSDLNEKEKEAFNDGVIQPNEWSSLGEKVREIIQSKGTVALTGMEELGNLILKDLWDAIEKEIEQSSEPLDAHIQERAYHDRFIAERTRLFFGRKELLENMLGYVSNIEESKPIVVTGLPGCGKSALMAECARQCREKFPDSLVLPHFIGAVPGSTDLLSTIRSLCETLRRECKLEDEVSADPDKLRGQLNSFLEKAGSVRSIIIILDAVNQLDPAYRSHEFTWIPSSMPPNVRLIVSTLAGDCLEWMQKRISHENILQVPVLPEIDRKSLIKEHLARRGKKLSDNQIACILDTEKRLDAGLPLYLLVALEELCLFGNYEKLNHEIDNLPETLNGLFDKVIGRLESEHFKDRTEFILCLMAVSRYGLLESEILDLLNKYDVKIPRIYWTRFYRSLEFYLRPLDEMTGSGLINFYHDQLRFAVYRRYLGMNSPDAIQTEKYRHSQNQLADYFHSIASEKNGRVKWSTKKPRSLIELPYHMHESGRDEELRNMLFDFGWIYAKLEAIDVNSLIRDYDFLPSEKTLSLVQEMIRLSAHILAQDKMQLRSQLYGRLISFQEPEIRSLIEQACVCRDRIWLRPLSASLMPPGGPLIRTLIGHTYWVNAVSITPDGRRAISASTDKTLIIWDMETGVKIRTLKGHTDSVTAVSVTQDGRCAISASSPDSTLKVWDMETGVEVRTLKGHTSGVFKGRRAIYFTSDGKLQGHTSGVFEGIHAVSLTPDGKRAILASSDKTLKIWDMETGVEIRTLKGHTARVNAVSVTPDGRRAISASYDKTLKIWDMESGVEIRTLKGHTAEVMAICVTPDGRCAISASWDHTLKVWDMETGNEIRTLKGHTGTVSTVSVMPDGRHAISASYDKTLKVWDIGTGNEIRTLKGHTGPISALSVTPNGRRAVSASWDFTLKVWDMEAGIEIRTSKGHTAEVSALSVTPNGRRAISASKDGTLKVWDMETGVEIKTLKGHNHWVNAVYVTPDSRRAISASGDFTLKVWDMETGMEIRTLKGHTGLVYAVSVTPDGRRAISISKDGTLKIWDMETGMEIRTLKGHTSGVFAGIGAICVTPDGRRAISASYDKTLKIWDMGTGVEIRTLEGHTAEVSAISVTPDGKRAISASHDETLKVWDIETGVEIRTLKGHTNWVNAVCVTPDGKRAISASGDFTLKVWDMETGEEIRTLKGHTGWVNAVCVTPDGKRAISASNDSTLKVWDIESSRIIASFCGDGSISCLIAPNGKTIVAGEDSGRVHFLRLEGIEIIPNKKTLAVGEIWDIGSGWVLAVESIDTQVTPRKAWLLLYKDGIKKEDIIASPGNICAYVEKRSADEMNLTLDTIFVEAIFAGATSEFVKLTLREEKLLTSPTRTFRSFVSSTFSNLKAKYSALHTRVFPPLR